MAAKRDFYEVLGIDKNADEATIKKAYRKLAKKYHPDMNKGNPNAEKIFQEVTEAYEVLGDPKKRKLYDEYGPISLEAGFDPEKMKQAQYGKSIWKWRILSVVFFRRTGQRISGVPF